MAKPTIKYAPHLDTLLTGEDLPGFVRNLSGTRVPIDSVGAAYAVAEITVNAQLLTNRAYTVYSTIHNSAHPDAKLEEIAWMTYLQMAANFGRNLLLLADLVERHRLSTGLQSARMAQYGVKLDSWAMLDGAVRSFRTPADWRAFAGPWNQSIVAASQTSGDLPMAGTGAGGMGIVPLLIGAAGLTLQLASGATLAASWPAIIGLGVVGAATVVGIYGIYRTADAWTEYSRQEQEVATARLSCFDAYAAKWAETGDQKYREIMLKCADQADEAKTNWTGLVYVVAGAVALLAVSNIVKSQKS
jgi:hypothetical protein